MKFLELLQNGIEIDCELIVGGAYMPATFIWGAETKMLPEGIEVFKGLMDAECEFDKDKDLIIYCDNSELGKKFAMYAAGYVSVSQYDKLFEEKENNVLIIVEDERNVQRFMDLSDHYQDQILQQVCKIFKIPKVEAYEMVKDKLFNYSVTIEGEI